MKALTKLFFVLAASYFSACSSPSNTVDTGHQQKLQGSSAVTKIFITFRGFDSSNLGLAWFYYDNYNQQIKITPKTDSISIDWQNCHLLQYSTIPQTGCYPVAPGDSIVITANATYPY